MNIDVLGQLAGQGLLGLLLVLAIGAIIYQYKDNKGLNKDIRDMLKDQIISNQSFQRTIEVLTDTLRGK